MPLKHSTFRRLVLIGAALGIAVVPAWAMARPNCQDMAASKTRMVEGAAISIVVSQPETSGSIVTPSPEKLRAPRAFCRIRFALRPSARSRITSEVWLPENWNGRYFQAGNGGLAGKIPFAAMNDALARGYAVAGTDDGTTGDRDLTWQDDPVRQIDYRGRAVHLTAVAAKALLREYYGRKPAYSFFVGGSKGGQEALFEVQEHPRDFNGVVALYPTIRGGHMSAYLFWTAQVMNRKPGALLKEPQLALIHSRVLAQCANRDGGLADDPFLVDPASCNFDPGVLACVEGNTDEKACLTPDQVETARILYRGPPTLSPGDVFNMSLKPGSEAPGINVSHGWRGLNGIIVKALTLENMVGRTAFNDPAWSLAKFNFNRDLPVMLAPSKGEDENFKTDISAFKTAGGKLIVIHGWNDPIVPAGNTLTWYDRVVKRHAANDSGTAQSNALKATRRFARLFMVPGFGHGVGSGLRPADPLSAIEAWVLSGKAPATLPVVRDDGVPHPSPVAVAPADLARRNLCVWPQRTWFTPKGTRCAESHSAD